VRGRRAHRPGERTDRAARLPAHVGPLPRRAARGRPGRHRHPALRGPGVGRLMARRGGPAKISMLILLGLVVALGVTPAAGRAAQPPTFEPGHLTSDFPRPVSWSFAFRSDGTPQRVELLTALEGSGAVFVTIPGPD